MYEMKPILGKCDILLPKCMYEVKSIYSTLNGNDNTNTKSMKQKSATGTVDGYSEKDVEELAKRQAVIMEQLYELKDRIAVMRKGLGLCAKPAQPIADKWQDNKLSEIVSAQDDNNLDEVKDIVINANPSNIPYTLLALKELWKNNVTLYIKCYTHSTVTTTNDKVKQFEEKLQTKPKTNKLKEINITLIWKEIDNTEMITTPGQFVPIIGEQNILRYLSRVGPKEYCFEQTLTIAQRIDIILDICYLLINSTSIKDKRNLIKKLEEILGPREFFSGQLSVADIAVSSAIKQTIDDKQLSSNLNKWMNRLKPLLGY